MKKHYQRVDTPKFFNVSKKDTHCSKPTSYQGVKNKIWEPTVSSLNQEFSVKKFCFPVC